MQLTVDRLLERLQKPAPLAPCYFLYGEEPLQLTECGDALRRRATADGISERLAFTIESAADWQAVRGESGAMSLFAERRLIEIRLGSRKPDKAGGEWLAELAARGEGDDVHVVVAGKLDGAARRTRWFKALEKGAVCVASRDLKARDLPGWLNRRAARHGKRLSGDAAALIAERVEGNLLAAAQEVEKLCLVVDAESIDARAVLAAVTDSARYDPFQFVDAVLARDALRALRVLRGLREEGTEPVIVNWALGRELRQLAAMATAVARGQPVARVIEDYHVWQSRRALVRGMLERHDGDAMLDLLAYANRLDTVIKGGRPGAPWDELELLALRICGVRRAAGFADQPTPN